MESIRVDDLSAFPKTLPPFFGEYLVDAISQTRLWRGRLQLLEHLNKHFSERTNLREQFKFLQTLTDIGETRWLPLRS